MQNWFECTLKCVRVDNDGRERKVSENYLTDAVSFTDAEARMTEQGQQITRGEFQVKNIRQSNVIEVFPNGAGSWYKAKISLVTVDERAGKEVKINQYFLVEADDLEDALRGLKEGLSYILVPFTILSIAATTICDVFPYFAGDETEETEE